MKKRVLAALLASATILSVVGCSNNGDTSTSDSGNTSTSDSGNTSTGNTSTGNTSTDTSTGTSTGETVTLSDDGETLTILAWEENSDIVKMVDFFLKEKGYDASKVKFVGVGAKGENARDGYKQYLLGDDDALDRIDDLLDLDGMLGERGLRCYDRRL